MVLKYGWSLKPGKSFKTLYPASDQQDQYTWSGAPEIFISRTTKNNSNIHLGHNCSTETHDAALHLTPSSHVQHLNLQLGKWGTKIPSY